MKLNKKEIEEITELVIFYDHLVKSKKYDGAWSERHEELITKTLSTIDKALGGSRDE